MRLLLFAWLWIHDPESRESWNPYDREVGRGKYFFGQANTGDLLQSSNARLEASSLKT
jgi:hypothetical protein